MTRRARALWVVVLTGAAAVAALAAWAGSVAGDERRWAELDVAGQSIRTWVDSDIAHYYLAQRLRGQRSRPAFDAVIDAIEREVDSGGGITAFGAVARSHSTDLAALMLWRWLAADPANRAGVEAYRGELARLRDAPGHTSSAPAAHRPPVLIAFAPGWLYRTEHGNGADFARPRELLAASGTRTVVLDTDENGTIERNADHIARQLRSLSFAHPSIVVVSASKAGPEVALALTQLHRVQPAHSVRAWVNIGGILGGAPLADRAMTWPWCWVANGLVLHGRSFDGIESMTTSHSAARRSRIAVPSGIAVINYIGIPLSGQVSERARLGYAVLRGRGPNDGLSFVADEVLPGGITIAELGLDHFFIDPDIDRKTIALTSAVIRLMQTSTAPQQAARDHRSVSQVR